MAEPTSFTSVAVTAADGLQVGGNIVRQHYDVHVPLAAASVDSWVFIATRACQVTGIKEIHSVVGSTSAAVKFRKITDTSAPGASAGSTVKELQSAAFDLTAAVNTTQTATLVGTTADLQLAAGDKIAMDVSGTLTGLVGVATLTLKAI